MGKKLKTFTVTVSPPASEKQQLPLRPTTPQEEMPDGQKASVQERTQIRTYHLGAESPAAARSVVDEQERRLAEQENSKPWKVAKVKAD